MMKFFCVPFIVEGSRNDRKMDFPADVFSGRFKKSIGNVGSPLGGEIRRGSNCLQDLQRQKNKSFTFVVYTTPLCSRDRKLMYICDKTLLLFSLLRCRQTPTLFDDELGFHSTLKRETWLMIGPWLNWNIWLREEAKRGPDNQIRATIAHDPTENSTMKTAPL